MQSADGPVLDAHGRDAVYVREAAGLDAPSQARVLGPIRLDAVDTHDHVLVLRSENTCTQNPDPARRGEQREGPAEPGIRAQQGERRPWESLRELPQEESGVEKPAERCPGPAGGEGGVRHGRRGEMGLGGRRGITYAIHVGELVDNPRGPRMIGVLLVTLDG
ncbi:hypothetical protein DL762_007556 [Monosporascus cannonballus]|uniref:Uncharacterized protein n=1 Tax=Monosporascus cannonballus TaxID=155416 RepID=A0ABY0H350_9PEZI|nr:hypothetical protein DL762_007556 [Monosporascus cannonballus]